MNDLWSTKRFRHVQIFHCGIRGVRKVKVGVFSARVSLCDPMEKYVLVLSTFANSPLYQKIVTAVIYVVDSPN